MNMNLIVDVIQAVGTIVAIGFSTIQIRKDRILREKEQALRIVCWMSDIEVNKKEPGCIVEIMNESHEPIYNVAISIDCVHYDEKNVDRVNDECSYFRIIPPGHYLTRVKYGGGGMHAQFGASISFTDSKGKFWYRDSWGRLFKKKENAILTRNIPLPAGSDKLEKCS